MTEIVFGRYKPSNRTFNPLYYFIYIKSVLGYDAGVCCLCMDLEKFHPKCPLL